MKRHYRMCALIISLLVILFVFVLTRKSITNTYANFPLKLNEQCENLPKDFVSNQIEANAITDRFFEYLRETKGATHDDAIYTVNGIRAENFPPYYAGAYINEEGRLVVQITDTYYSSNYKESEWYGEFVKIVESETFYCHPVKYSYCELVNAISEITLGELAKRIKAKGVTISFAYIDDYRNKVAVGIESQEDYDSVMKELDSDIYSASVTEGSFHDATNDLYPGEGVISETVPFSVACRVKRNYPDGTSTNGILTCAHAFSGTQTVYLNYVYPIGISYSFNQHYLVLLFL